MTDRLIILFTSALLSAAVGCRNSAKRAEPAPTASPTPTVRNVTPGPPIAAKIAAPAQTEVVQGPPIQVAPPATFTADQLNGRPTQFVVPGQAGQFLRVKVNAGRGVSTESSVSVQFLTASVRELKALYEQGDCSGNFVYQLPETGNYHIEFKPAGQQMGIDFSLLDVDDPMLDPGIKSDHISIDFGLLGKEKKMKLEPFGQWAGCSEDYSVPSHWVLDAQTFNVDFRVMQVAGYKKALEPDSSMDALESAIRNRKLARVEDLPYPYIPDSGLNMWGRQRFLQWDGWKGISWVGAFAQDYVCGFDGKGEYLAYVVQAISDDGRFFVMMRVGISNPQVARRLDQKCEAGPRGHTFDELESFFKTQLIPEFDKEMSAADPASFTPNLDQLDAVIKSLKLKR